MKKTFTIIFCLLAGWQVQAQTQLSNGGFESWTMDTDHNVETPDDWQDGIICVSVGASESCTYTVEQTTDAHSGTYALRHLDTDNGSGGANYQTFGNFFLDASYNLYSPAFTGRPTSVSFYYKYSTDDNQPMTVSFILYTGDLASMNTVGAGSYSFSSSVSSYTEAVVNITYTSSDAPTAILVTSDYDNNPTTPNDILTLDDIVFKYDITAINESSLSKQLNAYVVNKTLHTSLSVEGLAVSDLTGKTVASFQEAGTDFSLLQLKTGVYILSGMVNDQPVSSRLFVD